MQLSIKAKLILIGIVAAGALILNAGMSYRSNLSLMADNDAQNNVQDISRLNEEVRTIRLQFFLYLFETNYQALRGGPTEESIRNFETSSSGLTEGINKIIALHPSFIDPALLDNAKTQIAAITANDMPKLLRNHASPDELDAALKRINAERYKLKDTLAAIDKTVADKEDSYDKKMDATVHNSNSNLEISFVVSIAALLVIIVAIAASILQPLRLLNKALLQLAQGNNGVEIPGTQYNDEIGDIAKAALVFKENAIRMIDMTAQQEAQEKRSAAEKRKSMDDLANTFESNVKNAVDMVASAATEMDATSRSVSNIVDNNKQKLEKLTAQIQGTSRNVQTVASATTQLSSAVNEINQQITRATSITNSAVAEAQQADETVQTLTDAAQKIGEVVEMINSIAAQINLLALNATIEAARAGDAGKGFAVVASEVKSLATQTTKATEQIGQYISSIQNATGETVGAIKNIGGKIREINEISTHHRRRRRRTERLNAGDRQ